LAIICGALPAFGNTLTVTSLLDDGGSGTLRSVIASAASGDTVIFSVTGTITLGRTKGVLTIGKNLIIAGPGPKASNLTISGGFATRVIDIDPFASVSLKLLTITNGFAGVENGGGIFNSRGELTISECTISNNSASASAGGGGIFNDGSLTVDHSTVSGNSAGLGGGIYNSSGGTATFTNSTLAGNGAITGGAAFNVSATTTFNSSTLAGNSALAIAGGIVNSSNGTLFLKGTLLANGTTGRNCVNLLGAGAATSNGYNLSDDNSCTFLVGVGDKNNDSSPGLDPGGLTDNGGPTLTVALLPASDAINAISRANCPADDQRGFPRPDESESSCDIGAFESVFIAITIEIKPGSSPAVINPKSKGLIAVAIFSGNGLNARTDIDRTSLTFGHSGTEHSLSFCDPGDQIVNGVLSLMCHFENEQAGFQAGDTVGILLGKTITGVAVVGSAAIQIVP
jgi:hypothetical protein